MKASETQKRARRSRVRLERLDPVKSAIDQWEDAISDLWNRFDSLDRDKGVAAMRELADACPARDGRAAFELAGMYDSMGFETEACAEYERALERGLDDARHAQLAVQYGSTLRNLGRLDEAIAVLSAAPTHPSTGSAPRIVLALALHSAGRKDEALRVAIESQIEALPRYQRSMRNYAAELTDAATPDARSQ
jgi:tetratricopeptide (TPR) repeat protein